MITQKEVLTGLFGAYRLARLDAGGMVYFDKTLRGFWHSFYAGAIVAPLFLILIFLRAGGETPIPVFRFLAVETISFVIALFIFPLIMVNVAIALDRVEKYISYIVAYNWALVWQNVIFLPIVILSELGLIPTTATLFISSVIIALILVYSWFVARTALDITTGLATMIVVLDFSLTIFIEWVTQFMMRGG